MTALRLPIETYRDPSVIDRLTDRQIQEFMPRLRLNKFIPHMPHPRQHAFLLLDCEEALFGGAAGGGKSDALLMGALQYVDLPGYAAVLIRRKYTDLTQPGALIPRAAEWLADWKRRGECQWHGMEREWQFKSGSIVKFGYLNHDNHLDQYQGGGFQYVGFDELTQQGKESHYLYLFSRMRKLVTQRGTIPLRMRGATNPGGRGEDWVFRRFFKEGPAAGRIFIKSTLDDNPSLDADSYDANLRRLHPATYQQLKHGIWGIKEPGRFFRRTDFEILTSVPEGLRWIRDWDFAASKEETAAWTAGGKYALKDGIFYISNMVRLRGDPGEVEAAVVQTANLDGKNIKIYAEQEGGSGGVNTMFRLKRLLTGWVFIPYRPRADKLTRALPVSSASKAGNMKIVIPPGTDDRWVGPFLAEAEAFPNGFKDQIDTASSALDILSTRADPSVRRL